MLSRISGWLRTRLLKQEEPEEVDDVKYFAIHEYHPENGLSSPGHKAAMSTPWRTHIMNDLVQGGPHRRVYRSYKVFSKE